MYTYIFIDGECHIEDCYLSVSVPAGGPVSARGHT